VCVCMCDDSRHDKIQMSNIYILFNGILISGYCVNTIINIILSFNQSNKNNMWSKDRSENGVCHVFYLIIINEGQIHDTNKSQSMVIFIEHFMERLILQPYVLIKNNNV